MNTDSVSDFKQRASVGICHTIHVVLAAVGILSVAAQSPPAPDEKQILDFCPQWDDRSPLSNPHKGWYHHYPDNHVDKYKVRGDADLTSFPGMDHVYLRMAWAYLEPKEGQYNWPFLDEMIARWTNCGFGIAFRISCRETSTDRVEQQYATPKWVMEAGAKGGHFRMGKATGPEGPWEPDFGDPVFLEKLEHFLAAFAGRYDGQPWLRYIDVGSIGDWGEGHTWAGSRTECGFAVRKKHIDLHLRHFKKSQLILSDDFVFAVADRLERKQLHQYALEKGISYRDDSILVDGYLSGTTPTWTVRSPEFFADAFPAKPTVFELEHYGTVKKSGNWEGRPGSNVEKYGKGKKGPDYFRGALELLHASYIGYHGYAHEWLADNPELTAELLNRCGYWYFLHRIELPAKARSGADCQIEMTWENRGVAPAYHAYELQIRLEGPVTLNAALPSNNKRWQPLPKGIVFTEKYSFTLSNLLPVGAYTVKFKLYSPETGRDVQIAIQKDLRDKEGFYKLGNLEIVW
jgi:hypothetical protein